MYNDRSRNSAQFKCIMMGGRDTGKKSVAAMPVHKYSSSLSSAAVQDELDCEVATAAHAEEKRNHHHGHGEGSGSVFFVLRC